MVLALLALLALLIALLAIPVTIDFRVQGVPIEDDVRLVWAFGLLNVRLRHSPTINVDEDDVELVSKHVTGDRSSPIAAFRRKEFRRRLLRFAHDLWQAVRKDDLRLHARLGLGDPAETGQLWGLLGPLSGVLRNVENADILIEPEFAEARLEFDSSGRVTIVPLEILGLVLALALSPPIWRGLRAMRT